MPRFGRTHIRVAGLVHRPVASQSVRVLVLCICAAIWCLPAFAEGQHGPVTAVHTDGPGAAPSVDLARITMLMKADRDAEAYQLAVAMAAVYPNLVWPELAAAYAAVSLGRCDWADRHFNRIGRLTRHPADLSRRDALVDRCRPIWRRALTLSAMFGYRPSITNRSWHRQIYAERGSKLYHQCVALAGLCRPDSPFIVHGQRDSAIDMWFQATLTNSWHPRGPLRADIISILFRRHPSRSKLAGTGALLRGLATYEISAGRKVEVMLGGGWSQFQLGRGIQPVRQRHQQLDTEFFWRLAAQHFPDMTTSVAANTLQLQASRYKMNQRTIRFHLNKPVSDSTSVDMHFSHTKSRAKAPHLRTRTSIRRTLLSMTHFLSPGLQLRLGIGSESRRHGHRLSYLATPHRVRIRRFSSDIIMQPHAVNNVKVVLNLTSEKISSRNPLDLPSQNIATLRIKWHLGP
ncbi:MAG: hypothetical protein ACON4I_07575 [Candidatus Puniceispirillaceae bacterium]